MMAFRVLVAMACFTACWAGSKPEATKVGSVQRDVTTSPHRSLEVNHLAKTNGVSNGMMRREGALSQIGNPEDHEDHENHDVAEAHPEDHEDNENHDVAEDHEETEVDDVKKELYHRHERELPPTVITMSSNPKAEAGSSAAGCSRTDSDVKLTVRCCSFKLRDHVAPAEEFEDIKVSYSEAMEHCESSGHRLCTEREVLDGRACGGEACEEDSQGSSIEERASELMGAVQSKLAPHVWTSSVCEADVEVKGEDSTKADFVQFHRLEREEVNGHLSTRQLEMQIKNVLERQHSLNTVLKDLGMESAELKEHPKLPFKLDTSGNKRDVVLDGWNLDVRSSSRTPGEGNLVIGLGNHYDHADNSIVAGEQNTVAGDSVSVLGGWENMADGHFTSVLGGHKNTARNAYATVAGGVNNTATMHGSVVSGGTQNVASGEAATVNGGSGNTASGLFSAVGGGMHNEAAGETSSVSGGTRNKAAGQGASIADGADQMAHGVTYR